MSGFWRYIMKRLVYMAVTVILVSLIVFGATEILPGDLVQVMLGMYGTEEQIAALEQQLGLNRPLYVRYLDWFAGFVTFNWGSSWVLQQPIAEVIKDPLIRSMQLAIVAEILLIVVAIPMGVVAAVYRNRIPDLVLSGASYVGLSTPEFVTGTLLILLFGGPVLGVLPAGGYEPLREGIVPWLKHIVLPATTLTIFLTAHVLRMTRSEMVDALNSNYVRTARLKGLAERTVVFKHALRNGLLPTITVLALDFGYLMGGIVVVEEVFAYPGIGGLLVFAIRRRDVPLLQMLIVLIAVTYVVANLVADLLYAKLNPKIEYEG